MNCCIAYTKPSAAKRLTGKQLHGKQLLGARYVLFFICALTFALAESAAQPQPQSESAANRVRNIVLILVDTLRADHLPVYGYSRNTAPFLAELGNRSLVFERAFSTCSSTAPATASLFTSLYPTQHGVRTGFLANAVRIKKNPELILNKIPEDVLTIAELLKQAGFNTFSVSDNLNIGREMGFDQGFDRFETFRNKGAQTVIGQLRAWANEIRASERYFLYLHFMDPHKPYERKSPWYEEFARSQTPSPFLDRPERKEAVDAYDSEIRHIDESLKGLFSEFGWEKDSLVILVADHGEEFWEHKRSGHGVTLYRETTHIPLILYYPGVSPGRIEKAVSITDVLPTIAAKLNQPKAAAWQGHSLLDALRHSREQRLVGSELVRSPEKGHVVKRAVAFEQFHLIESPGNTKNPHELYYLSRDFNEQQNLAQQSGSALLKGKELLNVLRAFDKPSSQQSTVSIPIDNETLNQLKSLGYVQ